MQDSGEEQSLAGSGNVSSPTGAEERSVLEEELRWARLERQKVLALCAEADEAIWNLAELARRRTQERDEARNQARMLLADIQARNAAQAVMLPGAPYSYPRAARPGVFAAAGGSQAFGPTPFRPPGEMTTQGQHGWDAAGQCIASSSSSYGHSKRSSSFSAQPSLHLHGLASSSQDCFDSDRDRFDPDMFLVDDVAESPQDAVPALPGKDSGAYGRSFG